MLLIMKTPYWISEVVYRSILELKNSLNEVTVPPGADSPEDESNQTDFNGWNVTLI